MTALRVLINLEYSRYRLNRQGKKRGIALPLAVFALLMLAGTALPSTAAPEAPFLTAALLLWTVVMGISAGHMINFNSDRHKDWFLTFPHSRLTLLQAKTISLLKMSLKIALLISAAASALYAVSVWSGRYEALPAGELLYMLAAYMLFIITLLPLAVILGLLLSVLMSIQSYTLLLPLMIPYTLLWMSPLIAAVLLNYASASIYQLNYISPSFVLLYSAILLILDLAACYFLLPLIADKGFSALAQPEKKPAPLLPVPVSSTRSGAMYASARSQSPFLTLFRLDISRLRKLEGLRFVIVLKYALPVLTAVAAYFLTGDLEAFQSSVQTPFTIPVILGSLWMLMRSGLDRKQLTWWLLFPQSRLTLLVSRMASVWVTVTRINAVLACSAVIGILAGLAADRIGTHDAAIYMSWLFYSLIVYTLDLTLALGLLQSSFFLMHSKILSLLMFPLALVVADQSTFINKYLFPVQFSSALQPSWSLLGWTALIGLPLAAGCTVLGAKYFHLALETNKKQSANKQA